MGFTFAAAAQQLLQDKRNVPESDNGAKCFKKGVYASRDADSHRAVEHDGGRKGGESDCPYCACTS